MINHSASILGGQGLTGSALQHAQMNTYAAQNAVQTPVQPYPSKEVKDINRYRFIVRKVLNGFILEFDDQERICLSIQEVQDQVAVCMVERNLDK